MGCCLGWQLFRDVPGLLIDKIALTQSVITDSLTTLHASVILMEVHGAYNYGY
jgi:hypothetical protein